MSTSAWELGPGRGIWVRPVLVVTGTTIRTFRKIVQWGRGGRTFRVEHETLNCSSDRSFIRFTTRVLSCSWKLDMEWPSTLTTQPFHNFVTNVSDSFLGEEKKQPTHLFNSRISYRWILFHPADKRDWSINWRLNCYSIHLCTIVISALPWSEDNTRQSGWNSCRFGCNLLCFSTISLSSLCR